MERLAPVTDEFGVVGEVRGQGPHDRRRAGRVRRPHPRPGRGHAVPSSTLGPPACSSARAASTATACASPRRSASPRTRPTKEPAILLDVLAHRRPRGRCPVSDASTDPTIVHWLDGKPWAGTSERTSPVFNPATGEVATPGARSPRRPTSTPSSPRRGPRPTTGGASSLTRRVQVLFAFRELVAQHKDGPGRGSSPPSTARCSPTPWARSAAGSRSSTSRAASRTCSRAGYSEGVSTGVDVLLDPPARRRGRRHHAVQLPGHGPHVDVPGGHRVRQRVHPQAQRARPVGARCCWPSCGSEAGLPDGVFSVVHGDKEAVDALLTPPRRRAVSLRRVDADRPRTSTRPPPTHGKRVQALGGAKNHMVVLPDADLDAAADAAVSAGYGSAGERCMAISVVVAVDPVGDDLVERDRRRASRT